MAVLEILQRAVEAGLTVWIDGQDILVEGEPTPLAIAIVETLQKNKPEVLYALTEQDILLNVPFPIGYVGLPLDQVNAALMVMNNWGIDDLNLRKYNVLSWVRGFYQDHDQNHGEGYTALLSEQARLGTLLESKGK